MLSKTLQGGQSTSTAPAVNERFDIGAAINTLFPAQKSGGGDDESGAVLAAAIDARTQDDIAIAEERLAEADAVEKNLLALPPDKLLEEHKETLRRIQNIRDPLRRGIALNRKKREWMNSDAVRSASKATVEAVSKLYDIETLDNVQEATWGADLVEEAKKVHGVANTETLLITMHRNNELKNFQDRSARMEAYAKEGDFAVGATKAHVAGVVNTTWFGLYQAAKGAIDQQGALTSEQEFAYRDGVQRLRAQAYEIVGKQLQVAAEHSITIKDPSALYKEVDELIDPLLDVQKHFGDVNFVKRSKDLWEIIGLAPGIVQGADISKMLNMLKDSSIGLDKVVAFAKNGDVAAVMKQLNIPTLGQNAAEAAVRASLEAIAYITSNRVDNIPDPGLRKLAKMYALQWVGKKPQEGDKPITDTAKNEVTDELKNAKNAAEFFEYFNKMPGSWENLSGNTEVIAKTRNVINELEQIQARGYVKMENGQPTVYRPSKFVGDILDAIGAPVKDLTVDEEATRDLRAAWKFSQQPGAEKLLGGRGEIDRINALVNGTVVLDSGEIGISPAEAYRINRTPLDEFSDDKLVATQARLSATLSRLSPKSKVDKTDIAQASSRLALEINRRKLAASGKKQVAGPAQTDLAKESASSSQYGSRAEDKDKVLPMPKEEPPKPSKKISIEAPQAYLKAPKIEPHGTFWQKSPKKEDGGKGISPQRYMELYHAAKLPHNLEFLTTSILSQVRDGEITQADADSKISLLASAIVDM